MGLGTRDIAVFALPLSLQSLFQICMTNVDVLMVGQLGEEAIASVSAISALMAAFLGITTAFTAGAGAFVSQFHGRRAAADVHRANSVAVCSAAGLVLGAGLLFLLARDRLLALFSMTPAMIALAHEYWVWVVPATLMGAISVGLSTALRSLGLVRLVVITSMGAVLVNTAMNALLINGYAGFPALGLAGAGIASFAAKAVELLGYVLFAFVMPRLVRDFPERGYLRLARFDLGLARAILSRSSFLLAGNIHWQLGYIVLISILATYGAEVFAAHRIVETTMGTVQTLVFGLTVATQVLAGRALGRGDVAGARAIARRILWIATGVTPVLVGAAIVATWLLSGYYTITDQTETYIYQAVAIYSLTFITNVLCIVLYDGVFPAGGDTRCAFWMGFVSMWGIAVPLTASVGLLLSAPFAVTYTAHFAESIFQAVFGLWRYRSGKWAVNLTRPEDA